MRSPKSPTAHSVSPDAVIFTVSFELTQEYEVEVFIMSNKEEVGWGLSGIANLSVRSVRRPPTWFQNQGPRACVERHACTHRLQKDTRNMEETRLLPAGFAGA